MKKEYLAPEFESVKIHGEDFLASSPDDEFDKDNFEGEIEDGNQGGIF